MFVIWEAQLLMIAVITKQNGRKKKCSTKRPQFVRFYAGGRQWRISSLSKLASICLDFNETLKFLVIVKEGGKLRFSAEENQLKAGCSPENRRLG